MVEADLARPVIEVRDFLSKRVEHEIYTYGEQVVVMPVDAAGGGGRGARGSARDRLAADQLEHALRRHVEGPFDVEITGESSATLYVPEKAVPMTIGRAGANVRVLENATGMKLDVRPMTSARGWDAGHRASAAPAWAHRKQGRFDPDRPLRREAEREGEADGEEESERVDRAEPRFAELTPELRKSKKNIVLLVERGLAGQPAEVVVEDEPILRATVGQKGDVRIARGSEAGERILDALARGEVIRLRV
jgi:ATPase